MSGVEADGVWVRWDDIDPGVRRKQYLIERDDPDSVFVGSLGIVDLFGMRAVCVKPGTPLMGGRIASAETALFSDPVSDARTNPLDSLNMIHSDVRDILLALGLGDHARPYSMHEVVRQEIIPAIERMRQRLEEAS